MQCRALRVHVHGRLRDGTTTEWVGTITERMLVHGAHMDSERGTSQADGRLSSMTARLHSHTCPPPRLTLGQTVHVPGAGREPEAGACTHARFGAGSWPGTKIHLLPWHRWHGWLIEHGFAYVYDIIHAYTNHRGPTPPGCMPTVRANTVACCCFYSMFKRSASAYSCLCCCWSQWCSCCWPQVIMMHTTHYVCRRGIMHTTWGAGLVVSCHLWGAGRGDKKHSVANRSRANAQK